LVSDCDLPAYASCTGGLELQVCWLRWGLTNCFHGPALNHNPPGLHLWVARMAGVSPHCPFLTDLPLIYRILLYQYEIFC
jgi:hypothetical protein